MEESDRDRRFRQYIAQQQAAAQEQAQPVTQRFATLEQPTRIIPVERPVCDHHRDIEARMRVVERAQIVWEAKWKPLWFLMAAAGGGLVTAGIGWALGRLGG
jgi:hypothetical protein